MSIRRSRLLFGCLFLAVFVYAAWEALSFPRLARYLPLYISVAGAVLTAAYLAGQVVSTRRQRSAAAADATPPSPTPSPTPAARGTTIPAGLSGHDPIDPDASPPWKRAGYFLAWTVGFAVAIWILDVRATAPLFVMAFLRSEADVRSVRTLLLSAAGALIGLIAIGGYMQLRWPASLIQLPW